MTTFVKDLQPGDGVHAPDVYARLSQPHPTVKAAREALDAFFLGVRALRGELGIPDVAMVVSVRAMSFAGTDGMPLDPPEPVDLICRMYNGDNRREGSLLSYGLGGFEAEQAVHLNRFREQGRHTQTRAMAREHASETPPVTPVVASQATREPGASAQRQE